MQVVDFKNSLKLQILKSFLRFLFTETFLSFSFLPQLHGKEMCEKYFQFWRLLFFTLKKGIYLNEGKCGSRCRPSWFWNCRICRHWRRTADGRRNYPVRLWPNRSCRPESVPWTDSATSPEWRRIWRSICVVVGTTFFSFLLCRLAANE